VDTNNVKLLGVTRMQTAETVGKTIWNRVTVKEENIRIKLDKLQITNRLSFLLGLLTCEDGTGTLSRNVCKQLPHDAA
jgi:hypothetical protein